MPLNISFRVIGESASVPVRATKWLAYLNRDKWDDWGKYCTQFYLTVVEKGGATHPIGTLKIGQRGMKPSGMSRELAPTHRIPSIPPEFDQLPDAFFSVGQDEDYYVKLNKLGDAVRKQVLISLGDVAFDRKRWNWAMDEDVMKESLLRSITKSTVQGQFRRMAHGNVKLTKFQFTYSPPKRKGVPNFELDFSINPDSSIPTNVHVLIGRNGVGKTRLLSLMAKSLVAKGASAKTSGKFRINESGVEGAHFANLVAVSFSAFDEAELLPERTPGNRSLGYSFIGLRGTSASKSPDELAHEFVKSLEECRSGARLRMWKAVIATLQTDPVFRAEQFSSMILKYRPGKSDQVLKTFKGLSSGHKIVLLTLTRLVEKVEEKTLVLIDEPEAHLHPPLLSAMTRAVSELMVKRNAVAIVATHSPVILQEVPKSCVWILNRVLTFSKAERPTMETFAESVGTLSREVFQLELVQSGYHQLLGELRQNQPTYDDALLSLGGQLGAEGKAVLRGMYLDDRD